MTGLSVRLCVKSFSFIRKRLNSYVLIKIKKKEEEKVLIGSLLSD